MKFHHPSNRKKLLTGNSIFIPCYKLNFWNYLVLKSKVLKVKFV